MVGKLINSIELKEKVHEGHKHKMTVMMVERIIDQQKPAEAIPIEWLMEYAEKLMISNNALGKFIIRMIGEWKNVAEN